MKLVTKYKVRWFVFLVGLIGSSTLILWLAYYSPFLGPTDMVRMRRIVLMRPRIVIDKYKEVNGRYPNSLAELWEYSTENPDLGWGGSPVECFSDPNGTSKEFNVLNGEGGWYYDKNSGELRYNLTKPVKHYLRFYLGPYRNEIPADW